MSFWLCFLAGLAVCSALAWYVTDDVTPAGFFTGLVICVFLVWLLFGKEPDFIKAARIEQSERDRLNQIPHVVRELDGCKTYRVMIDMRWHYYTRCSDQTTHMAPRTESCGKSCTRTEIDSTTVANER